MNGPALIGLVLLAWTVNAVGVSAAETEKHSPYAPRQPFVAEPYVPPPPPVSRLHLKDNGDGTITDPDSGLMWTQKDSYADLGKCLNWFESREYAKNLLTGGHGDWRMPSMRELASIYDPTKDTLIGWDHLPDFPLHIDEQFADGAAYWYWVSDHSVTQLTDCCAESLYFVQGLMHTRRFSMCDNGGVRAVRSLR
jgi:hypothetical protein